MRPAIEESRLLRRAKQIYEALHPETKRGVAGGKAGGRNHPKSSSATGKTPVAETKSFTKDTAEKTGKDESSVRRDVAIATGKAKSDRQIAEHVGVGHAMVSRYRRELELTVSLRQSTVRTGRDGRTINTENIGRKPTATPQPAPPPPTVTPQPPKAACQIYKVGHLIQ